MATNPQTQKSEVHATTGDASTSPTGGGDIDTTRTAPVDRTRAGADPDQPRVAPVPPTDVHVVRDETDDGGPLVIQSNDPDLNPPRVPIDPFPTERTPEIDPPVK
jgi:hypothetical protein